MPKAIHILTNGVVSIIDIPNPKHSNSLEIMQRAVGGLIELVTTIVPHHDMYVNEEGLLDDLPINPIASRLISPLYVTLGGVRGNVLIMLRPTDAVEPKLTSLLAKWGLTTESATLSL